MRKQIRAKISLLLILCTIVAIFGTVPVSAEIVDSGKTSDVTWTLDSTGTLSITGIGDAGSIDTNFSYEKREKVKKIILKNIDWINDGAFYNYYNLTSAELPQNIKEIGAWAFSGCKKLKEINLPDTINLLGEGAFSECESLTEIHIPPHLEDDTIPDFTFCGTGLKKIVIPDGIKRIGQCAFGDCKNLKSAKLPDNLTKIGYAAFVDCSELNKINIPYGIKTLNAVFVSCYKLNNVQLPKSIKQLDHTFYGNKSITSFSIPENVTALKSGAFANCENLKCISIPASVTIIENRVFEGCTSLTDVFYAGSEEDWNKISFERGDESFPENTILKNVRMHFNCIGIDYNLIGYNSRSTSVGAPSILSAYITYKGETYDILSQPVSVVKDSEIDIGVKANVDANGCKSVKMSLTQGLNEAIELTDGVYKTVKPGVELSNGEVYLLAVDEDTGKSTSFKTKLTISERNMLELTSEGPDGLNFTLFKKNGFTMPENLPVLGGMDMNWEVSPIPISVEYDQEDDNKINIVFGANILSEEKKNESGKIETKWFKGFSFKEYKKSFKKYKEDMEKLPKDLRSMKQLKNDYKMTYDSKMNLFGGNVLAGADKEIAPSVDITGYAELKVIDGKLQFAEGEICLEVEIALKINGQVFIWVVPCYYEIEISGKADLEGKLVNVNPKTFTPEIEAYITAQIKAMIEGGIGIAKVATVGASGEAAFNMQTALHKTYFKTWLDGEAAINIKVLGKTVASKTFAKGYYLIYETGSSEGLIKDDAASLQNMNIYDLSAYVDNQQIYPNEDRSYAKTPTTWQSLSQKRAMLKSAAPIYSNKNLNKLASNVYTESKPMICDIDGTKVMVMQWDNTERAAIDRTILVYSVYDENTASWSEPLPVYDDGTADFYPCFKDGWLVWQNSKSLLSDDMTLEDIAKKGEICITKWNGNGFDIPESLTDNDSLDTLPTVCTDGENACVTWIINSNNDILGISGNTTIMQRKYANGKWSDTTSVKSDLNAILSLTSGYVNNKFSIAYIEDNDDDLGTLNDRNIIVMTDDNETNITNNEFLNSNPIFIDDKIYYYSNGNIVCSNIDGTEKENIFNSSVQGLTDNFVVDTNSNGDKAVWWAKSVSGGAEIFQALYKDGEWSSDIQVTSLGNTAKYPSGLLNNDGTMLIAFNNAIVENNDITQTDLYTISVEPSYDLELSDSYIDESTMTVYATVKNTGELPINSYTINLDDNGANNSQTINEPLPAGTSKNIEIAYNKPENFSKRTITLSVISDNCTEYNLKNNSAEIPVGLSDISITTLDSYEKLPLSSAVVTVENCGNSDAENVVLSLRKNEENGEVIASANVGNIQVGEKRRVTLDYEPQKYENNIWYVTAETTSDEITRSNNSQYFVNDSYTNLVPVEHKILNYSIKEDNTLVINTYAKNNTGDTLESISYAAVYNKNNKLMGVTFTPITIDAYSDTGIDFTINNYTKNNGDYIKAFIWDGTVPNCKAEMQPLQ